jgi:polysaccharide export outer membrane protein
MLIAFFTLMMIAGWGCTAAPVATPVHQSTVATVAPPARSMPPAPSSPGSAGMSAARGAPSRPELPAPAKSAEPSGDYLIAPRDQLAIQVHGQDDLTRNVRVSENGSVTLPLVGEIAVAGLTAREIEQKVEGALKPAYLKDPRVTVTVSEFMGRQFAVVGAVNQPGAYSIRTNQVTLLQALSEARGLRENADRTAYLLRATPRADEPQPLPIDLDAMFRTGQAGTLRLESGDMVFVPDANSFYVAGEIEKRGAYTLRRDTTLSKALVEAGGVTKRASGQLTLVRVTNSGQREEITGLDVEAIMRGDPTHDLALQAQDIVVVPTSGAKAVGYGFLDFLKGIFSIGIPLL